MDLQKYIEVVESQRNKLIGDLAVMEAKLLTALDKIEVLEKSRDLGSKTKDVKK